MLFIADFVAAVKFKENNPLKAVLCYTHEPAAGQTLAKKLAKHRRCGRVFGDF
jgi:hypothetical protein